MNTAHNIYIHVPYCIAKCRYCAFFSHACRTPDWDTYTSGIIAEIDTWHARLGRIRVPTVFFGGGTPSLMPTLHFARIMDALRKNFDLAPDAEITAEANPGTIDEAKLREFVAAGITRLSIGVQSLNDDELRYLGRIHSARDALQLMDAAQKMPIRVSADFIYALPGWETENVKKLCRQINELGLKHCSLYELTIEDGTPLSQENPKMPDNDAMADMYCAIEDHLALPRYEVSNHAAPGFECAHNMNVWDGAAYIGLGDGAAGRVFINDTWYEQRGGPHGTLSPISNTDRATEKIITGLRTRRGVCIDKTIENILNTEYVNSNPDLVRISDNRMTATPRGILILDDLLVNLIR